MFVFLLMVSRGVTGNTLVLVSIDGFGHDYLDRFEPPALLGIAGEGWRVRRLLPVYPTNTFPTHLSMATGLLPEVHGIEDNHFCDQLLNDCYHLGAGKREPRWLKGMPIWSWVEARGGIAATYFWPESDAPWGGQLPTYYLPYKKTTPYDQRIEQVLQWLRLSDEERPQLVTLYFSLVDTAGHDFGPDSPEVAAAVQTVDRHIGDLWRGLQALEQPGINLLIVSDHGMAAVNGSSAIVTSELPRGPGLEMLQSPARVQYYPKNEVEGEVEVEV
ncbi:MAG: ectonucleotide pyrophosphatase/phosphodiesterase, partial [Luminiphilus sp.]|nr:ectonucleotide pyrophosphatase/phosphodiesterase [Luminiphilus sp.]